MERNELVRALRCHVTVMDERNCDNCPFYRKEELPEYMTDTYPDDFLCSCDTDRIALMAADGIEAQAREIETLRARVPQWVSVKERLPEPMTWVLCLGCDGNMRVLRRDNVMGDWDFAVFGGHCYAYNDGFVTHWMPLPEGPKEEA